mgnify:CR=1 FL=1
MKVEEPDELTEEQFQELSGILAKLETELMEQLAGFKEQAQPVDLDLPIGRLSRMDAIQQKQMAKANKLNAEQRLLQVRNALTLVKNDDYGWCKKCDEPVGYPRLKARPETPFCLTCQSEFESRRK